MSDVSTRDRVFEVWLDRGIPGAAPRTLRVGVPAGEDADELCAEALDALLGNCLDTGWREIDS